MDILYTVASCVAAVGALIVIYKVITHPVNQANFEHYINNTSTDTVDPWSYLNYRNPPY